MNWTSPTTLQILYAQEDLWVLRSLMLIIKATNGDADAQYNAAVKEIMSIELGAMASGIKSTGSISGSGGMGAGFRCAGSMMPGSSMMPGGSGGGGGGSWRWLRRRRRFGIRVQPVRRHDGIRKRQRYGQLGGSRRVADTWITRTSLWLAIDCDRRSSPTRRAMRFWPSRSECQCECESV